jgi:molybdopterin-guanine dinucleotide biosynthesis protein A
LPAISADLVRRLVETRPEALALAPREPGGPWYALSARYAVAALPTLAAMLDNGEHALQRVFARLGEASAELPLLPGELDLLADWDRPEDRG